MSIALIAIVFAIGLVLIVALAYWNMTGELEEFLQDVGEFFTMDGLMGLLIIFWIIALPVLLLLFLILSVRRRRKMRRIQKSWEDCLKYVMDAQKKVAVAEFEEENRPVRFNVLSEMAAPDPNRPNLKPSRVSMEELCVHFRNFSASKLGLYYTEEEIREFIAGLAVSHMMILQGMSGTGKTSLAYAFGEFVGNPTTIIPVQPMWKECADLLGYYNEFTKKFNETTLLRKMYEANGQDKIYIIVLDEMNVARVEYYFAEFLSMLEIPDPELRYLHVISDVWENDPKGLKDGRIKLPENMWFIGTANNDDSTFSISDKVYDRSMILNLNSRAKAFESIGAWRPVTIGYAEFVKLAKDARKRYALTGRNRRRLKMLDAFLRESLQINFGNRIMKQIEEYVSVYVSCGGGELEALDDIIAKKILRKLENKEFTLIRRRLDELGDAIGEIFGEGKMKKCLATIDEIVKMQ